MTLLGMTLSTTPSEAQCRQSVVYDSLTATRTAVKIFMVILIVSSSCVLFFTNVPLIATTTGRILIISKKSNRSVMNGDPVLYSYNQSAGLHCSDDYRHSKEPKLFPMSFCLFYKKAHPFMFYRRFIGKIFSDLSDATCYVIDQVEFRGTTSGQSAWDSFTNGIGWTGVSVKELPFDASRFWFLNSMRYRDGGNCSVIEFSLDQEIRIHIDSTEHSLRHLLLARAYVYTNVCRQYHLVPALYSPIFRLCFYTEKNSGILPSRYCQVLCDDRPEQLDLWYDSN